MAARASGEAVQSLVEGLARLMGRERVSTAPAVREQHGKDESWHPSLPPDAVVFPRSTAEVGEIVRRAAALRVPVIAFGTGTSLEGHVGAPYGGITISLRDMNRVLAVNAADMDARVEAGVTRKQINAFLRDTGLFFPVDPGADATLGGMAATGASGTNAVRYGTMRENVLAMTVVLADGSVVRTGSRARKSSSGYDLTRLFVGSEGTLGVITELDLRLYGIPEAVSAAVAAFPSLGAAVETTIATIQAGVPVARVELLDGATIAAVNRYSGLSHKEAPTLFFEFHGSAAGVKEQAGAVQAIAAEHGAEGFAWTATAEERNRLWQARHDAYYAILALRPGAGGWPTDVCVPISRLSECIRETLEDMKDLPFPAGIVGHVGDGNFHVAFVIDRENAEEVKAAERFNARLIARALAMDGTATGEHGVGRGKIKYMEREHGAALAVMRRIKRALDPDNLMNPGKVVEA
ncbi:MAG: FAD-binding protein [Proteobacteria bacterium]|nr:FAD-binding protein [Pseudomonadota bacterium]